MIFCIELFYYYDADTVTIFGWRSMMIDINVGVGDIILCCCYSDLLSLLFLTSMTDV